MTSYEMTESRAYYSDTAERVEQCTECRYDLQDDWEYCPDCGSRIIDMTWLPAWACSCGWEEMLTHRKAEPADRKLDEYGCGHCGGIWIGLATRGERWEEPDDGPLPDRWNQETVAKNYAAYMKLAFGVDLPQRVLVAR